MVLILCQCHIVKTMVLHSGGSINRRSPVPSISAMDFHLNVRLDFVKIVNVCSFFLIESVRVG